MKRSRKPPLYSPGKGYCRWCNQKIKTRTGKPTKRRFHTECFEVFKSLSWSKEIRKSVLSRDSGICQKCGKKCSDKEWEADHIIELADIPRPLKKEDRRFWRLSNLQLLCTECHKDKSFLSAKKRRLRKSLGGQQTPLKTSHSSLY